MINLSSYKKAFQNLPDGAEEAEVNAELHSSMSVTLMNRAVIDVQASDKVELFVRVSGQKTGYAYTQDAADDAEELLKKAYENGLYTDMEHPDVMNREAVKEMLPEKADEITFPELKRAASEMEDRITQAFTENGISCAVMVSLTREIYGQYTVNSHGLDCGGERAVFILSVGCHAGGEYVASDLMAESPETLDLAALTADLLTRMKWLSLPEVPFTSGDYEVILSEAAVGQMFMTAWQEFSAVKYAGGATPLAGLLGEKVAGDVLTIHDLSAPSGGYPMYFDCEGTKCVDTAVVEQGVFRALLTNRTLSEKLQVPATGNAGRRPLMFGNIATDILVTPKNFCIVPGEKSLSELEAEVGDGILITEYFDLFHSLDISSGNFSVPCYGVLLKDGKEAGLLKGLNMSGNFRTMLSQISAVGNTCIIHPMDFLQNYGIGSCALRVGRLGISGE